MNLPMCGTISGSGYGGCVFLRALKISFNSVMRVANRKFASLVEL